MRGFRPLIAVGAGDPPLAALIAYPARAVPACALRHHLHAVGEAHHHTVAGVVVHVAVEDRRGMAQPQRHVALREGVRAPLTNAARVKIVLSVPATFDIARIVRPPRRRPQPGVPVQLVARRLRFGRQPGAVHVGAVPRRDMRTHRADLAEPAQPQQFVGHREIRLAQALGAGLENATVTARCRHHRLPLRDRHRAGLLAIDIFAGAHRQHRGRGVPAVAGGDQHRVDVSARGQKLANVAVGRAILIAVFGVHHAFDRFAPVLPHVADRHELGVLLGQNAMTQIGRAAPADPDAAHHDPLAGRDRTVSPQGRRRHQDRHDNRSAGRDGALEKTAAAHSAARSRLLASDMR
ncbi:MAG: hypothetical protein BWX70_02248 [Verrucomicrobia bacterium ADurb.Bin070]|nr:MAG: hypothetical protein BWX70_02248 [Verrucomicrobia bacterium ADurb.Bin070]